MTPNPDYPTIRFMLKHGQRVAALLGVAIALTGVALAVAGGSWIWTAFGLAGGVLAFYFTRLLTELVQIVADTLIPQ